MEQIEQVLVEVETIEWVDLFMTDPTRYQTFRIHMFKTMALCTRKGRQDLAERCWHAVKTMDLALLSFTRVARIFLRLGGGPGRLESDSLMHTRL